MALYAIGDVQGCDTELGALLTALKFSADRDSLWFVGDLVNRGPDSLKVLRRIRAMGDAATVILGNHDLHLLAVAYGRARIRSDDTLDDILAAVDRAALLDWLQERPMFHEDAKRNLCMVHAGLPPQWDLSQARSCAHELEKVVPMTLCKVAGAGAIDAAGALRRLGALYPECVRFALQRGDAVFLGASPERLCEPNASSYWLTLFVVAMVWPR